MLSIILTILKVAGYILLAILAILILAILLVLFVPIRYRAAGAKYEDFSANADVTWLFRFLHILFSFDNKLEENKLSLIIKILWFTVYSNFEPSDETKDIEEKREELSVETEEITELLSEQEEIPPIEDHIDQEQVTAYEEAHAQQSVPEQEDSIPEASKESLKDRIRKKIPKKKPGPPLSEKIENKLEDLQKKAVKIQKKKEHVLQIIENEKNQRWLRKTLIRLKKMLICFIPQFDRLYLHFGFKDPSTTGKTLGLLSLLYPSCEDRMDIWPEFEKQVLEGDAAVKGHIRLIRIAAFAVPTLLNPTFFKLIKQIKKI